MADPSSAPPTSPAPSPPSGGFAPTGFTTGSYLAPEGRDAIEDVPTTAGQEFDPARMTQDLQSVVNRASLYEQATPGSRAYLMHGGAPPMLSADEANKQFPGFGFTGETPLPVAESLYDERRQAEKRQDIADREPGGAMNDAGRLGVGFVSTLLDPVNLAASFIPVVGEARYGTWLAGAGGVVGRTAVRAGVGAAQGAVSQVPLEALRYGLSREDGEDWKASNALLDIAYGAGVGGLAHGATGALGELAGRKPFADETDPLASARPAEAAAAAAAPLDVQEAALRTALAQSAEGRPVEVTPIIATAQARGDMPVSKTSITEAPRADIPPASPAFGRDGYPAQTQQLELPVESRPDIAARVVKSDVATLPSGEDVPVKYAVVDARDLVPSQRPDFSSNPDYPAELQPRDRTRSASAVQVQQIAQNINPRLLGESATAADGAPIIGPDGVVESGNGRVMALNHAYEAGLPTADGYKQYLAEKGYPVEGLDRPVLVRVRDQAMTTPERAAFARQANERTTLAMGTGEQATADAKALPDSVLALHRGGDVGLAANRDFVRGFIRHVVGPNDRAAMLTAEGGLSQAGRQRIEAALLSRAYDDPGIIAALTEDPESNFKAIGRAITDVSPVWALMRKEAAAGEINPEVDISRDLLDAINLVRLARDKGQKIGDFVNQRDMFGGGISPKAEAILRLFFRNKDLTGPRGGDKIAEALAAYVDQARNTKPGPGLFGDSDVVGSKEILERLSDQRIAEPEQSSLFGGQGGPGRGERPGGGAGDGRTLGQRSLGDRGGGGAAGEVRGGVNEPTRSNSATDRDTIEGRLGAALDYAAGKPTPEETALTARADAEAKAPTLTDAPEIPAHVRDEVAELEGNIRAAIEAGALPKDLSELQTLDATAASVKTFGQAVKAAAACMARNL